MIICDVIDCNSVCLKSRNLLKRSTNIKQFSLNWMSHNGKHPIFCSICNFVPVSSIPWSNSNRSVLMWNRKKKSKTFKNKQTISISYDWKSTNVEDIVNHKQCVDTSGEHSGSKLRPFFCIWIVFNQSDNFFWRCNNWKETTKENFATCLVDFDCSNDGILFLFVWKNVLFEKYAKFEKKKKNYLFTVPSKAGFDPK